VRTPPITIEDVRRVAKLAGLALTDAEADRMTAELGRIIEAFSAIRRLDLPDPGSDEAARVALLRDDQPGEVLGQTTALGLAGEVERFFFVVPRVVGE
jgi:aspartyl-tRNA(Asn)/glutamyl-tRNA(Gln) amidotransferase subunit C